MRTIIFVTAVSAALPILSAQAQMQMPMPGAAGAAPGPMQMQMGSPAAGPAGTATGVKGEVTRIDLENGRVSIRHEPIPNLTMNGMNMVFRVAQPSLVEGLKVGDKVVFEAERKDGAITLTKVEKATN